MAQPGALGHAPRLRLGQGQQWQTGCTQHTARPGQHSTEHTHQHPAQPPPGRQAQLAGDLRTIQPAQAGGHIGQQQPRQQITTGDPGQTTQHGENTQFQGKAEQQGFQTDAARTQVANQATALLKCQANGGMRYEQANDKGQQAKRSEIEVKAIGEALQVAIVAGLLQCQLTGNRCGQGWHITVEQ
ncbi:hypothetical protein D3C77_359840 [compost metagenome]